MITVHEHPARITAPDPLGPHGDRIRLRLMVVDDHPAVRLGLKQLLDDQPDFVVVDAASSAEEARSLAEREPIDVAVVDYQLGLAQRAVAHPDAEAARRCPERGDLLRVLRRSAVGGVRRRRRRRPRQQGRRRR